MRKPPLPGLIVQAADAEDDSQGKGSDRSVPLSPAGMFDQTAVTSSIRWTSRSSVTSSPWTRLPGPST